jgi:hypothetical protein
MKASLTKDSTKIILQHQSSQSTPKPPALKAIPNSILGISTLCCALKDMTFFYFLIENQMLYSLNQIDSLLTYIEMSAS